MAAVRTRLWARFIGGTLRQAEGVSGSGADSAAKRTDGVERHGGNDSEGRSGSRTMFPRTQSTGGRLCSRTKLRYMSEFPRPAVPALGQRPVRPGGDLAPE